MPRLHGFYVGTCKIRKGVDGIRNADPGPNKKTFECKAIHTVKK